jgi:hypothetical protein
VGNREKSRKSKVQRKSGRNIASGLKYSRVNFCSKPWYLSDADVVEEENSPNANNGLEKKRRSADE